MHQINIDGNIISDIERDHLHREILRTQGRLNTQFKYDRNSRLQCKQIQRNQNPILPDILLERSYQYDNLDRLVSKKHSKHARPITAMITLAESKAAVIRDTGKPCNTMPLPTCWTANTEKTTAITT